MLLGTAGVPLPPLGAHELLVFWVQVVVLLAAARPGWVRAGSGRPAPVIGELLAGVALGPPVGLPPPARRLGPAVPRRRAPVGLLLGSAWLGIALLLMATGVETDLRAAGRQGRAAATTAVGSLVVPLAAGVVLGAACALTARPARRRGVRRRGP